MKIWLSKNSEVSVREQIVAQISLGIVSGDLSAGEKLPSTRELARRFQIHQNTVSAAYRELAEADLVEVKKGSGVYVRENRGGENGFNADALEQLISRFLQEAAAQGFSRAEIKNRLQKRFAAQPPKRFLLVESDAELRKILTAEVRAAVNQKVDSISLEEFAADGARDETRTVLIFDKSDNASKLVPPAEKTMFLKANSVPNSMNGKQRPSENDLIAVVSGWEKFLELAKMFLLAARVAPETLVVRHTAAPDWKNRLAAVSMIICDAATANEFLGDRRVRVFDLIAESSLNELRKSIE